MAREHQMAGVGASPGSSPLRSLVRPLVVARRHRGLRSRDLVLASFPKSGNTWMRFVLGGALSGRDLDFDVIKSVSPPVGSHKSGLEILPHGGRLVKSHELPRFVGPAKHCPRVLYLVRDGRDIAASYFHHLRRRGVIDEDFAEFFPTFVSGQVGSFGSWQAHARAWIDYGRANPDMMTVRYEDLLLDPQGALRAVSDRFELELSDEAIRQALESNTPSGMRAKETTSVVLESQWANKGVPFVREAKAGTWQETLDPISCARFERVAGQELVDLGYRLSVKSSDLG